MFLQVQGFSVFILPFLFGVVVMLTANIGLTLSRPAHFDKRRNASNVPFSPIHGDPCQPEHLPLLMVGLTGWLGFGRGSRRRIRCLDLEIKVGHQFAIAFAKNHNDGVGFHLVKVHWVNHLA
jgi:hypothetical protein